MQQVLIRAIGYYVPEGRISNERVMELFHQANASWISDEQFEEIYRNNKKRFDFLGIQTRSACKDIQVDNAVNMAKIACQRALDSSGLSKDDIDCLIMVGLSNPFREPTFANVVAKTLGIKSADFFDINDTCNGFMKAMEIASLYIKSGKYKNVLIGTSENPYEFGLYGHGIGEDYILDDINDINYKFSIFICGSGAGAMIFSSEGSGCRFNNYAELRETDTWDVSWYTFPYLNTPPTIYGKKVRGYWTDARRIASGILNNMPVFVKNKLEDWKLDIKDIDYVFSHQLGDNITWGILDQLHIDPAKSPINPFKEYGNMASANIPVILGKAIEQKLFKPGDRILLMSSGAGLSLLIADLEW